jgi:hypothetical protein
MGRSYSRVGVLLMCALAAVGCGGGGVSLEPVEGRVTLDGAPLVNASVHLTPKDPAALQDKDRQGPFGGMTDDQGMFELGGPENPGGGVPAGAYTLGITTQINTSGDENAPLPVERVPPPHSSPGVDFEVPDGGKTDANFELTSK